MKVNKSYTEQLKEAWDDLGFHGYISPDWRKEYVVPIKIIIDECNGYKHYGHPLCVFVPNGYNDNVDENEFYALTVENSPTLIHYPNNPRVAVSDIYYVKRFIKENVDLLKKISDWGNIEELRNTRYYKRNEITNLNEDNQYDVKMTNLPKQKTGLDHDIWIDQGSKKKHGDRIKIKVDGEFITMDMGGIIRAGNPKKLNGKQLKRYREFIKNNKRQLVDYFTGKNDNIDDLLDNLYVYDRKGNLKCGIPKEIVHKTEILSGQDLCYGTRLLIYSGVTARYNVCEYGSEEPLFLDKSGNPILFDMICSFETDENDIIFAQAIKDNVLYKLYRGTHRVEKIEEL